MFWRINTHYCFRLQYLNENIRMPYVKMALRDTFIGDSTFRPNSVLIDFQFPGDMYTHARVYAAGLDMRTPTVTLVFTHLFVLCWFFIPSALSRISSNQTCATTAAHGSDPAFFFAMEGE